MFERFTDRARRVVVLAQEEARMLNHNYIGTEHILLGLIHEGEGVAAKALESLGISLEAVRQKVEEIIGHGQQSPSGHIPFTPRAKKVLELSLREALQINHSYIGTEHILLGLIREDDGVEPCSGAPEVAASLPWKPDSSCSTCWRTRLRSAPSFCSTCAATPSPSRIRPSRMCSVPM